ncbi:hypothetical protein [Fibrobacter succinogenes]|uniref:hypothetical protein n=1 Tax=Fibrobacter succinogenes TaxID=833 RepID=UPI0015671445|nr:hypothetical protein [Fibrobacter succinogenes]
MKFVRTLVLLFILLLPSVSLAEEDSAFVKDPDDVEVLVKKKPNFYMFPEGFFPSIWGIAVGSGPEIFSAGMDIIFGRSSVLYEPARPKSVQGPWGPPHMLIWMNRIRFIYDYDNHQQGVFFQPNLRYLGEAGLLLSVIVGPEIGWEKETGFEYGASIRIGGVPSFWLTNYELGYLVNSRKFYFTLSFCIAPRPFGAAMSI